MITVSNGDKIHLQCFHCGTDKNVCEINIDSDAKTAYIGFGLCRGCCGRLGNKIVNFWEEKEAYQEPVKRSFWDDFNLVVDEDDEEKME